MSGISPGLLSPPREILTPDEWGARGRARRERVSLEEQAYWDAPSDRPDPVSVPEEQAKTRVPDLVPIRYGRMLTSAFAYYRGAAAPMAWDLGHMATPDLRVQCCGDAHLLNFGMFAAPDRRLVFDVNDFDETLPAPLEWDVKRLAASFAVAARDNGLKEGAGYGAARRRAGSYRTEMAKFEHQGERVARGQRMIQAATDEFLGWTRSVGTTATASKDYYVRQLRDMKGSMDVPAMDRDQLTYHAELCGWALARGHARTGRATLISGYLGSGSEFDKAIAQFSVAYAEQNEKDYQALVDAVATGRVQAVTGLLIANPRPPLTGPLLLSARARPGHRSPVYHDLGSSTANIAGGVPRSWTKRRRPPL